MTTQTGGPAFPIPGLHADPDFNGMSLRDYFAAKAMQGLLASEVNAPLNSFATRSYDVADAMLKARAA